MGEPEPLQPQQWTGVVDAAPMPGKFGGPKAFAHLVPGPELTGAHVVGGKMDQPMLLMALGLVMVKKKLMIKHGASGLLMVQKNLVIAMGLLMVMDGGAAIVGGLEKKRFPPLLPLQMQWMASGVEPSFKAASAKHGAEAMGGGARKGVDSTKLFTTNASSLTMARLTPGTSATVEKRKCSC